MITLKRIAGFTGLLALLLVIACGGDATAIPATNLPAATAGPTPTTVPGATAGPVATTAPTVTAATAAPIATEPPSRSDIPLRANLGGEPNNLDPHLASSLLEFSVLRQLSQGLLGFDKDLILTPLVAAAVPTVRNGGISADGLTYTFKLKDGVTWSDGQPLTAGDFVYSFSRVLSPDVAGRYSFFYSAILGGKNT